MEGFTVIPPVEGEKNPTLRVLEIVGKMDRAGAETLLMNLYRAMDREKVQLDFLVHREEPGDYDDEIKALGGRIYRLSPMMVGNLSRYFHQMKTFWGEHPGYTVVHSHIDAMSALPLWETKRAGVPVRIAHSHNTAFPKDKKYPIRLLARRMLPRQVTHYLACSSPAGEFLFPKGAFFGVLPNAIELSRFAFSQRGRKAKRWELGLKAENLVIGHVGRFDRQKNHRFLLEVFQEVLKREPKAVLLLVGRGELEEETKGKAKQLGISQSIRFLGMREDMPELYWAMDVFLLPSLYEGFPVVGVEAQAAGLPCVLSDEIWRDVKLTEGVEFLPLRAPLEGWAQKVLELRALPRGDGSGLREAGFEIKEQAKRLQEFYLDCAVKGRKAVWKNC